MFKKFRIVGVSHHTSPIFVREKFTLTEPEVVSFLGSIKEFLNVDDVLALSTCNRTEIWYSSDKDLSSCLITLLCLQKQVNKNDVSSYFWKKTGIDAVKHVYTVSLGLDARVIGDIQISNQVKRAYQHSADEGMAGPFLHRLMHSVFNTNKRVVQETAFRDGAASAASASVELLKQFVENFQSPKVLVLGLGEIGKDVADNLKLENLEVTVATRDHKKSVQNAHELGFHAIDLPEALESISDFDIIISSLAVNEPIVTADMFDRIGVNHKFLIDLAVPRSVSPEIENESGILLYNIDEIEGKTSKTLEKRKQAIPLVKTIIEESIFDLRSWSSEMEVSPTIQKLKGALDNIRREQISRYLKKSNLQESELIEKITKGIVQNVIKLPVLQLKAACKRGEADTLVGLLNMLFDLEKEG